MVVDGRYRDYRLFRPPTLVPTVPVPLVIVLHGNVNAAAMEGIIHFQSVATTDRFMTVYPDGCNEDWNDSARSYDVDFFNKMLDRLESQFRIDASRIYTIGASAGGVMAYRVACDMAARVAAVASIAGTIWWNDCSPARPIAILEMHGTADEAVPYNGGRITYHDNPVVPSVEQVAQRWAALDGCSGSPVSSHSGITTTTLWNRCRGQAVVRLDTVIGGHHTWFGSRLDPIPGEPDANPIIWSFLSQFRLQS
jgi:polyhydroxybutyrate depolymerase